jgi:hypothetical protein
MSLYNMHGNLNSLKNIERTVFRLRYDKLLTYLTRFYGAWNFHVMYNSAFSKIQ